AARLIQRVWRGWRIWGQGQVLLTLRQQAAQLAAAEALFKECAGPAGEADKEAAGGGQGAGAGVQGLGAEGGSSVAAGQGCCRKRLLEVGERAMRVVLALDGLACLQRPELRAVRKRLTARGLALQDQ
ncbi:hypothetical protein HaLaN_06430, partial [Haematococcus lacustris]